MNNMEHLSDSKFNDWHMLTKDLSDVPKEDGFYQLAYIREDGTKRIGKAHFRTHTVKKYFKDKKGRNRTKTLDQGWHMAENAHMKTVIAWRPMVTTFPDEVFEN